MTCESCSRLRAERNRLVETSELGQLSERLEGDNAGSDAKLVRSVMHERERLRAALTAAENIAARLYGTGPFDREQVAIELDAAVRGGLYPDDK